MTNPEIEVIDIVDVVERCREGKTKDLYLLMSQLRDVNLPNEILVKYIQELRQHVTELDKDQELLIGFILMVEWMNRPSDVIEEYFQLVKNIVSAHTYFLSACLKMIVENFKLKYYRPDEVPSEEFRKHSAANFTRLHSLLSSITKIVPMAPVILLPLLANNFPFYLMHNYVLECYVSNLLEVTTYLPRYRGQILKIIVNELNRIDAHIPIVDLSTVKMDDTQTDEKVQNQLVEVKMVIKLDILMELVLSYIYNACASNDEKSNLLSARSLLRDIIDVFEVVLLPSHESRFVQFIVFYICSFNEIFADEFLERLWKKFEDPNVQSLFRQTAILYIASYLVRAQHVQVATVKLYLDTLVAWVRRYIKHSPQSSRPDVKRHGPFYSACQAVFYVFVHRHEELLHTYHLKYCESLYLGTIATCWLNPLRVCAPHIATKFASVVRNNRIAFCDTVLERNRRCRLPEADNSLDHCQASDNVLNRHFPFEPYQLSRSQRFINDKYRDVSNLLSDEQPHKNDEEELYMENDHEMEQCDFNIGLYSSSPTDL